jgi:hypothetical protein
LVLIIKGDIRRVLEYCIFRDVGKREQKGSLEVLIFYRDVSREES